MMGLRAGYASDRGLVRQVNEDTYFLRPGLYAVCDGMGGARGGEVASQMACFGLQGLDPASASPQELREAVMEANRTIVERSVGEDHLMGMGTTLTAALIRENRLILAHVGDSRAYMLRDGDLTQLTEDHSWVGEMVRRGELTPAQAAIHPHRSIITRALGTEGDVDPDVIEMDVVPGDRIMLCSDGLTGMVADEDILEIMAAGESPQKTAELLVKEALLNGGEDNVTVVVIDITDDDETAERNEGSSPFDTGILFGPSDRGDVSGPPHGGRGAPGARERFGRRGVPPSARPVTRRPSAKDDSSQLGVASSSSVPAQVAPAGGTGPPAGARTIRLGRPRARLAYLLVLALVVALGVAVAGFAFYNSTIYYVGKYHDGTVALYRGLPGSLLGIELSKVVVLGNTKYDSLSDYEKRQVDAHRLVSEEEGHSLLSKLGP